MGQRLVVSIHKDRATEADVALYFHWGGYTAETACILAEMMENFDADTNALDIIRFYENKGGGVDPEEKNIEEVKKRYPEEIFKTDDLSRNDGLVSLGKTNVKEAAYWADAEADYYLQEREGENHVFYPVEEAEIKKIEKFKVLDFDPMKMTLDNAELCLDTLEGLENIGFYMLDDKFYGTIV